MLRLTLILTGLFVAGSEAFAQPAAKKSADFVDPTKSLDLRGFADGPLARPLPEWLAKPQAALTKPEPYPPAAPAPGRKPLEPRPVGEGAPLTINYGPSEPPAATVLATQPLLKQQVVDVQKAIPLPALAVYTADRVSLADPSMEISAQTILKLLQPERVNLVPFMAWNVPDPFENVDVIRLRNPWPENREPPLFVIPPTRR